MRNLLFLLLLLSSQTFAVDFYWQHGSGNGSYKGPTPIAACQNWTPSSTVRVVKESDTYYYCERLSDGKWVAAGYVYLRGDGCTLPKKWSTETMSCEVPQSDVCAAKAGTPTPFSKSGTAPDGYMSLSGGMAASKQSGCFSGCLASTADQKCKTSTSGPYLCRGTAWFTGETCASDSAGVDPSTTPDYPAPEVKTEDKPCNYTTNADGTQSCTSTKSTEQEGQVCGTVSATGQRICVDKKPTKNGVDIATNVETKTNADGTKETTKTDTATTTKCDGVKSCTSSSTTIKTTIKTDANGKTTSATGSCTGANCPDKNTNPDGNGDGFGDCVSGDCGEGGGGDGGLSEFDDVDDYGTTLEKFYDKVTSSPLATSVKSLSIPSGGSCTSRSYDLGYAGVQDASFFCTFLPELLVPLRIVFLAVWAWVAIRLFMTA